MHHGAEKAAERSDNADATSITSTVTIDLPSFELGGVVLSIGDAIRRARPGSYVGAPATDFVPDPYRLLDLVDDAIIIIGVDLRLSFLNDSAETVLRAFERTPDSAGESPARRRAGLVGMDALAIVHPDDRSEVIDALGRVLDGPGSRVTTRFRVRHTESWKPVSATATNRLDDPLVCGIVVCFRDLEGEVATQRLASRYAAAIESSSTIIVIHEPDGVVVHANAPARAFFEFAPDRCGGSKWPYPPAMTEAVIQASRGLQAGGSWEADIDVEDAQGDLHSLSVVVTVERDDAGELEAVAVSCRNITDRKLVERDLMYRAFHDELTGLPNRAALLRFLREQLLEVGEQPSLAVLFMDLDRFKAVNDSLGHHYGDELLFEVSRRLRRVVRPTDLLARLGGDEFVLVLMSPRGDGDVVEHAHRVADRIHEVLQAPIVLAGSHLYISASIGVATDGPEARGPEDVLRHGDLAMFRAKVTGRSRTEAFHAGLATDADRALRIESALHKAIDGGELRIAYQPIASLGDGRLLGFEALVRWRQPDGSLLGPDAFLDIAEQSDLVERIDTYVFERACWDLARWTLAMSAAADLTMAVNLSSRQLGRPDLPELVERTLLRTGLAPNRLVLEITENNLMVDLDATRSSLEKLRAIGVRVAIDDFGTGYSSLSYLHSFGADMLKIDRSFVARAADNETAATVVRAVTLLAATFDMEVIAEGVETAEQRELLQGIGCTAMQGYLLAPPGTADDARALILAGWPADQLNG